MLKMCVYSEPKLHVNQLVLGLKNFFSSSPQLLDMTLKLLKLIFGYKGAENMKAG